jgi:hypothetical protein
MTTDAKTEPASARVLRWLALTRRTIAVMLLLVGVVYALGNWQVCEDKLATVGTNAVVRICRPPTLSDVPVAAGLLLVLLLFLPDLSEIGIPGFVSLKRQVQEQDSRILDLDAKINSTVDVQQAVTQSVDPQASANVINYTDFSAVFRDLRSRAGYFDEHALSPNDVPQDRAQLQVDLLRIWERLEPLVRVGRLTTTRIPSESYYPGNLRTNLSLEEWQEQQRPAREKRLTLQASRDAQIESILEEKLKPEKVVAIKDWFLNFQQEIQIVQDARHAVAHAKEVETEKLRAAVRLASSLFEVWQHRASMLNSADDEP